MRDISDRILGKYREPLRQLWTFGSGHNRLLAGFILLTLFGVLTESVGVFLLVPLLESMGRNNIFVSVPLLRDIAGAFEALPTETRLIWAGACMLVVVLLRGMLQFLQEWIGYAMPHRIDYALRTKAFDVLSTTSVQYVERLGIGQISNFAIAHPARIGIALRFAATLIANVFVLASFIGVLFLIAPLASFAAAVYFVLASLLFRRVTTRVVHKVGQETTAANERFGQMFYELLNGTKAIRLAGATQNVRKELLLALGKLQLARDRTVAVENATVPFFTVVGGVMICALVMLVGVTGGERAGKAVGLIVIFVVLVSRILSPLSVINISRNNIIIHLDAFAEYERFMREATAAREVDGHVRIASFSQGIRLEHVAFAYAQDRPNVLTDVTLDIPQGQMTAIVGPSGSGKSTLITLLTRLYRPTSGHIFVDGHALGELKIETWWRRIAVVTQDVVMLNDTIAANLAVGLSRQPTLAEMQAAAKISAIDEWIESLPRKYETLLGDRGSLLSGGQRQRIALARALLRQPEVFILDEATSSLDTLTEQKIREAFAAATRGKTVIAIAHRLSTVRRADQIVVLDQGRIVETGRHNELLVRDGIYASMIKSQSLDLVDDEAQSVQTVVG